MKGFEMRPKGRTDDRGAEGLRAVHSFRRRGENEWGEGGAHASAFGGTDFEEHGDSPIDFVLGGGVGHRRGVGKAGDFADLRGRDAIGDELAARGVGAVGGEFPGAVIFAEGGGIFLGVPLDFDGEIRVTRELPRERGENPRAIFGELHARFAEERFAGAIENVDAQALGGEVELHRLVQVGVFVLQGFQEVLGDVAEGVEFDHGGGIEAAGFGLDLLDGDLVAFRNHAGGALGH